VDHFSGGACLRGGLGNPRRSGARPTDEHRRHIGLNAFASSPPGSSAKAAVRLDSVKGKELKGTLLEKQSDTVYLLPSERTPIVIAVLSPDTSVVMGKPQDIAVGAVVQLAGTIDANHVLQTTQVVILTGYVRMSQKAA
jgi:hypothetical protein